MHLPLTWHLDSFLFIDGELSLVLWACLCWPLLDTYCLCHESNVATSECWSTFNAYWTYIPAVDYLIFGHSKCAERIGIWCCVIGALQSAGWTDFQPGNFGSSGNYYCWLEVLGSEASFWTTEIVSPLLQEDLQNLLLTALLDCCCGLFEHSSRSSDFMDVPCRLLALLGTSTYYVILVILFQ